MATRSTSGPGPLLQLRDGASSATIAPERGALVASFIVDGRELLYMDAETLNDPTKNVRGGIPVLFPSPGKLEQDVWRYGPRTGGMKQHGFARNLPWSVSRQTTNAVTLTLTENAFTLSQYPWAFCVELHIELRSTCLMLDTRVTNTGNDPIPYGLGFHPYFRVNDKAYTRIPTRATRAFDNVEKHVVPFVGFDLTRAEVDLHLLDHSDGEATLQLADGSSIAVRASSDIERWVVWTLAGREFVCLEPWTAPGNALNSQEHLIVLPAGDSHTTRVEIDFRRHG